MAVYHGKTIKIDFTIDPPAALVGNELAFTAKRIRIDSDPDAVFTKVIGDGIEILDLVAGTVRVTIDPQDTLNEEFEQPLECDLQLRTGLGDRYVVGEVDLLLKTPVRHGNW